MNRDKEIFIHIPSELSLMRHIRVGIRDCMAQHDAELRESAAMVAWELVENAIKYGERAREDQLATFRFRLAPGDVTIAVASGLASRADYEEVAGRIRDIEAEPDKMKLYIERLQALLEHGPHGPTRLGLYRISAEGRFHLRCQERDGMLVVTATRELGG
jgi:hypothetical protein